MEEKKEYEELELEVIEFDADIDTVEDSDANSEWT